MTDSDGKRKVTFRDKNDLVSLPEIPKNLMDQIGIYLDGELNNNNNFAEKKIAAIYTAMQKFEDEFASTFTVCARGCSHCCNYDILAGRLEAEYIAIRHNLNLDTSDSMTTNHESPCPFLSKEKECTVYDSRPFSCRTLHALDDPKYCATPDVSHQLYGPSSGFGVSFYDNLRQTLARLADAVGAPLVRRDIRDWFPDKSYIINEQ